MNAGPVKKRLLTKTQGQLTFGIGLHDRRHVVCVIDQNAQILLEEPLSITKAGNTQLHRAATLRRQTGCL